MPSRFTHRPNLQNSITLAEYARHTGGKIFAYLPTENRNERLWKDLYKALMKETSWESVLRVRYSKGWKAKSIYGNYLVKSSDLLSVPHLDDSKSLLYKFELQQPRYKQNCFHIQVRTSTHKSPISSQHFSTPTSEGSDGSVL